MNESSKLKNEIVDFYGRQFEINKNVLTPRPESEFIIDVAKSLAGLSILPGVIPEKKLLSDSPKILDVGTGSGCLAITLKKEINDAEVDASDISKKALTTAKKNARNQNTKINFIKSDLLQKINKKYDLIVANLPYVDKSWDWIDEKSLQNDPTIALYAEDEGLFLIKKLMNEISEKRDTKFLILESDPCQHQKIISYAKKRRFEFLKESGFILLFSLI